MSSGFLSPQAEKSVRESRARNGDFYPTVKRTTARLILLHPRRGKRSGIVRAMKALGWEWDSKRCRFSAPLDRAHYDAVCAAFYFVNRSEGIKEWDK